MDFEDLYTNVVPQFGKMARRAKFRDRAIEIDDLVQDGCLLLIECMAKYPELEEKQLRGLVVRSFGNLLKDYYRVRHLETEDVDEPGNEPADDSWVRGFMVRVYLNELSLMLSSFDKKVLDELVGMNTRSGLIAHSRSRGLPTCQIQTMDIAKALRVPYWKTMRSVRNIREKYNSMRVIQ